MTLPYYPFFWGDYNAKTLGLTMAQHGAYILLLKFYYCTGRRVPHEQRYSIAEAMLKQEQSDVDAVLNFFFVRDGDHWFMPRAEEVVADYNEKHERRVKAGKTPKINQNSKSNTKAIPKQSISNASAMPKQPEPEPIEERKKEPSVLSKEKRATRLPLDFEPDQSCHDLAETLLFSTAESQGALENFRDYWTAVPGAKGIKLDWQATFRNWLRNDLNRRKPNGKTVNTLKSSSEIVGRAIDEQIRKLERETGGAEIRPPDRGVDVKRLSRIRKNLA